MLWEVSHPVALAANVWEEDFLGTKDQRNTDMRPSLKPVASNELIPTQLVCFINDLNSGILSLHFELGRRPRQPASPGKVDCESKCGSYESNQAGRVDPPNRRVFCF